VAEHIYIINAERQKLVVGFLVTIGTNHGVLRKNEELPPLLGGIGGDGL